MAGTPDTRLDQDTMDGVLVNAVVVITEEVSKA